MNQKTFVNIIIGIAATIAVIGVAVVYYYMSQDLDKSRLYIVAKQQIDERTKSPPETKLKQTSTTNPSLENALEYKYYDPNIPFSFRYPQDYCWTQDIAAVVIHNPPFCGGNNAVNVKGDNLTILAFPEEGVKTTEEYINAEQLRNLQKTGEKRNIGGYNAIGLMDPKHPGTKIYAFLTNYEFEFPEIMQGVLIPNEIKQQDYRYGVIIQSNLDDGSGGKEAEELILSSFVFR